MQGARSVGHQQRCRRLALMLAVVLLCKAPSAGAADAEVRSFDLSAQALRGAIAQFTGLTGIAVRLDPGVSDAAAAHAVAGRLTASQALAMLLSGTGLTYRFDGDKAVIISRAAADGSRVTGTLKVEGGGTQGGGRGAAAGPNGSSDVTATEGTHSLAAQMAGIGSKTPLPLKDITQSVSVITRQQIEDQHLDSISEVLAQTTGVTVNTGQNSGGNLNQAFYSRGFEIKDFQIDGGAPLTEGNKNFTSQYTPIFELSQYDHVEVLRGADGMFSGVGDPGGVVSLQRKRPLDHAQVLLEAGAGSNDHRRVSIDGTTAPLLDGKLGVRGVLTHDDSPFFYGKKKNTTEMGYLNVEFKPVQGTQINVGGSITYRDSTPWTYGLPRAAGGGDLKLSRDLCLCLDQNYQKLHQTELFAQLRQTLATDWSLAVNLTRNSQSGNEFDGEVTAPYSGVPTDGSGLSINAGQYEIQSKQFNADATLNGEFEAFGHRHQFMLGVDRQSQDGQAPNGADSNISYFWSDAANLNTFNPSGYPVSTADIQPSTATVLAYSQVQWGVFSTLRLKPIDRLNVTLGLRHNSYQTNQLTSYPDRGIETATKLTEKHTMPPFVSVGYELTPKMSAYASYASIYQSQANMFTADLKPLKPSTGTNIEAGFKRSDFNGTLQSSLAIYRIVQKNLAVIDSNVNSSASTPVGGTCCYLNADDNKNTSKGVDLEVKGAITPRWQVSAGYTFNTNNYEPSPSETSTEDSLTTFAPKNIVKLWTTYALPARSWWLPLQVGGGGRVQSRTYAQGTVCNSDYSVCIPTKFSQGGYGLLDVMARWRVAAHATVQLNVKNVFDLHYYQSVGGLRSGNWYGEPRNLQLSLNMSL